MINGLRKNKYKTLTMNDVKSRYGSYDPDKWQTNLDLKEYFEKKMGLDLYVAVDKENYKPCQGGIKIL